MSLSVFHAFDGEPPCQSLTLAFPSCDGLVRLHSGTKASLYTQSEKFRAQVLLLESV